MDLRGGPCRDAAVTAAWRYAKTRGVRAALHGLPPAVREILVRAKSKAGRAPEVGQTA